MTRWPPGILSLTTGSLRHRSGNAPRALRLSCMSTPKPLTLSGAIAGMAGDVPRCRGTGPSSMGVGDSACSTLDAFGCIHSSAEVYLGSQGRSYQAVQARAVDQGDPA